MTYKKVVEYIEKYWEEITFFLPEDKGIHIGLPNAFISPSKEIFAYDQFYWDSYFTLVGLVRSKHIDLARGMVENLAYLFNRFNIIPSRNRYYNLGISQPPFLTSMIKEIYRIKKDEEWLKRMADVAERELLHYWADDTRAERHKIYKGLSRYVDHYITHLTAEHESGWDMTSRFGGKCLDYLPIDLNCCLYKYEIDLAEFYKILNDEEKNTFYLELSEKRKEAINELMWSPSSKFFFDYNYVEKKQSDFYSLAGFYPVWSRMANKEQAELMKEMLSLFETECGLVNTQRVQKGYQWDWPNGWANQHWIVIRGLQKYGFRKDAKRIAKKWLDLNTRIFEETGKMWERYDVVNCNRAKEERYPLQEGFGWTNGVFLALYYEFFKNND